MKKIVLYTILHVLLSYTIKGQTFEWAKADNSTGANKMVRDNIGNFYVGDQFVAKYDSVGNFIWQQNIIAYGIKDLVVDSIGNVYATGVFRDTLTIGNITITSGGVNNMYLVKFNSAGIVQWIKQSHSNNFSGTDAMTIDKQGNPIIIGRFSDIVKLDGFVFDAPETSQVFLAKYSPSGVCLWAKHLISGSFSGGSNGPKIKSDKLGNTYISGHYSGDSAEFDNIHIIPYHYSNYSGHDIFLTKIDASGNFLWVKNIGGLGQEISGPMDVDSLGNTYISGYFSSAPAYFGNDTLSHTLTTNFESFFTAKYDTDGNCLWAKESYAGTICATNDGYYINTGFISKYNKSGTLQWTKNVSGASNSAMVANNANVYITGSYKGSVSFDTCTLSSTGNQMFIAKLGNLPITTNIQDTVPLIVIPPTNDTLPITTIIKDTVPNTVIPIYTNIQQTEHNNNFSVFPNPTGNSITVCIQNTNTTEAFTLRVTNGLSQIVYTEEIKDISFSLSITTNNFSKQIDLSQLPKGIYFVELQPALFSSSHNAAKRNITKIILQ